MQCVPRIWDDENYDFMKKNTKLRFGRDNCFYVITPLKTIWLNHNFGDMIHTWRGPVYDSAVCQYDLCKKYVQRSGLIPSEMLWDKKF